MKTFSTKQISVSINRPVSEVYAFASNPLNLPRWAAGLSNSELQESGDYWVTESPMGPIKIKFSERNSFGVLDHDVILPNGEVNHNPLRVVKNGEGSEVIFTLYKLPKMSDQDFQKDAVMIERDLNQLKSILEKDLR